MSLWTLWLCAVLLTGSGMAADIPYVFGEDPYTAGYTSDKLEEIRASSPDLAGVSPISTSAEVSEETMEFYNIRVEPDNPLVHSEALIFAGNNPGELTIDQICSIYKYLRFGDSSTNGWVYKSDPRGVDYRAYSNETLKTGKEIGCTGSGDCDDFAILMSSLIESIGGTTRIISACGNDGCHAYTEVYLGQLDAQNKQVSDTIGELKRAFDMDKIFTHIDTTTWDVWLNLDWWANRPGGEFYSGDTRGLYWIRDQYEKTPVRVSSIHPENVKEAVPDSARAWYNRFDILFRMDKNDEALQAIDKAIELEPRSARYWVDKGVVLEHLYEDDEALKAYEKAIELDPQEAYAWAYRGRILASHCKDGGNKCYDKAIKSLNEAIKINPQFSAAWRSKGDALQDYKKYDDAIKTYDKAIELDPQDYAAWYNKGLTLKLLGRDTEAEAAFAKAKELRDTI